MQLNKFTDYGLRVLMYLAVNGSERHPTSRIARSFAVSEHHLSKVASALVHGGFVMSGRGRSGGLVLSRAAADINIGAVVRHLCQETPVVADCFSGATKCKIMPMCGLRSPLASAQEAFMSVLDGYSLADVSACRSELRALLKV